MVPIPTSSPRPFIPAPGCVSVEAVYSSIGQTCENVYHILQGDGATQPTDAEKHAIADALIGWENATAKPLRHNATTLTLVRVRDLDVEGGVVVEVTPTPVPTGSGGAALPNNVTLAVKWTTGLGGRSHRGRTYHVGMPLALTTGNVMTDAGLASMLACYADFRTRMEAVAGVQLVVLSYAHNKFWRDTAQSTHITGRSINPDLDSQRRRLNGRGV